MDLGGSSSIHLDSFVSGSFIMGLFYLWIMTLFYLTSFEDDDDVSDMGFFFPFDFSTKAQRKFWDIWNFGHHRYPPKSQMGK